MALLSSLTFFALASLLSESVCGQSTLTLANKCTSAVFPTTSPTSYFVVPSLAAGGSTTIKLGGFANGGFQLSFSTGCSSDGTGCATGPSGSSPLFSAAFFQAGSVANSIEYNINVFEGFNVGVQIDPTGNSSCPAFSCDGLSAGCPVPGPSGTCFSPCCNNACTSVPSCPAAGPHDSFFTSKCPNAQSHFDYSADPSALPLTQATCVGSDITVTLCPGSSSNFTLAEITSGSFPSSSSSSSASGSSSTGSVSSPSSSRSSTVSSSSSPSSSGSSTGSASAPSSSTGSTTGSSTKTSPLSSTSTKASSTSTSSQAATSTASSSTLKIQSHPAAIIGGAISAIMMVLA